MKFCKKHWVPEFLAGIGFGNWNRCNGSASWLALAFFAYILIATGTIFFVSFRCVQLPPFPTPPINSGDPAQYKALVDAYKQSAEVYQQMAKLQVERATQLFQLVVASTILPVFSAILGYIFGSKKSGE